MDQIPEGEVFIPADHAARKTAKRIGLSPEFVDLAWDELVDSNTGGEARYRDWGLVLNNAIRRNWYKLWYPSKDDGQWYLTTAGEQRRLLSETDA